jgi:hypothetical protein
MRVVLFPMAGGILIGLSFAFVLRPVSEARPAAARSGTVAQAAAPARDGDIEALEARVRDLEAEIGRLRRAGLESEAGDDGLAEADHAPVDARELADVETLMALVERGDLAALKAEVLALLRAGEKGHAVLADFFDEELHAARKLLLENRPLAAGLAGLAWKFPEDAAGLMAYILEHGGERDDRVLYNRLVELLPTFLAQHPGRFEDLREDFIARLFEDVDAPGGGFPELALQALTELGVEAPPEALASLVSNPIDEASYRRLMDHIVRRRSLAGLDALVAYLDAASEPGHWAVRQALHALARLDLPEARRFLDDYRRSSVEALQEAAELASSAGSVRRALAFLNSGADLERKRRLVRQIAGAEPVLLEELRGAASEIAGDDVRGIVEQGGNEAVAWSFSADGLRLNGAHGLTFNFVPRTNGNLFSGDLDGAVKVWSALDQQIVLNAQQQAHHRLLLDVAGQVSTVDSGDPLAVINDFIAAGQSVAAGQNAVEFVPSFEVSPQNTGEEAAIAVPGHEGFAPGTCQNCHVQAEEAEAGR